MKLKYYLRGAGIGVIVTTLILMIAFHTSAGKEEEKTIPETEQSLTIAEALSEKEATEEASARETEAAEESAPAETENEAAVDKKQENEAASEEEKTETIAEEEAPAEPEDIEQPQEPDQETTGELRFVEFRIYAGQSPGAVSKSLYDAGIIDDEDAFYRYLVDNGLNDLLEIGTFSVPEGGEFSEIAKILTTNEYERKKAQ